MYPGQVHGFTYNKETEGFTLYFTNEFTNNIESTHKIHQLIFTHPQIITLNDHEFNKIHEDLERTYHEFNSNFVNKKSILKAYLEIILTTLLRNITPSNYKPHPKNTFEKLIKLKEENFSLNKEISAISNNIGISQKKLNSLSKTYFGKTFLQLLNDRKLLEIKHLLTTSDISIKEIAYRNGFSDNSYLNNFFKKHTGTTPLKFRKKYK